MNYHNSNPLENMMLNIVTEGEKEVWQSIEAFKDPLLRCQKRKLFAEAIKKINSKN